MQRAVLLCFNAGCQNLLAGTTTCLLTHVLECCVFLVLNVLHALASIYEQEGILGLYRGMGPSCMKLVVAAGISFMCYEACKRILVEDDEEA
jgi:hypothetical protein